MKSAPIASLVLTLAILAPDPAHGQGSRGVFRLPAQAPGRQAVQAPRQAEPSQVVGPVYRVPSYPRYLVAYTVLPAILMSDGSVYANFGHGYVPVRQSCARPGRVLSSSGVLHSNSTPPTYTQPVPAQATASQQMARAQSGTGRPEAAPRHLDACYRMDPYGPVVVVR